MPAGAIPITLTTVAKTSSTSLSVDPATPRSYGREKRARRIRTLVHRLQASLNKPRSYLLAGGDRSSTLTAIAAARFAAPWEERSYSVA